MTVSFLWFEDRDLIWIMMTIGSSKKADQNWDSDMQIRLIICILHKKAWLKKSFASLQLQIRQNVQDPNKSDHTIHAALPLVKFEVQKSPSVPIEVISMAQNDLKYSKIMDQDKTHNLILFISHLLWGIKIHAPDTQFYTLYEITKQD